MSADLGCPAMALGAEAEGKFRGIAEASEVAIVATKRKREIGLAALMMRRITASGVAENRLRRKDAGRGN